MGLGPGVGQEGAPVPDGRGEANLLKDPGEVGVGVAVEAADVLDDGVEDGTLFATLRTSEEQPVFCAELGRADGVFYQVVVDLDLAVFNPCLHVGKLAVGVGQRFPEGAAGKCAVVEQEVLDGFFQEVEDGAAVFPPST